MKINVQKLQSGGGFGMLFSAVANPSSDQAQQQATTASSESSKSGSDGILSKEVLNELRKHGLPNEVDQFEQILASVEDKLAQGRHISSREIASIRSMANRVIQQSNYLNKAIEFSEKNLALDDVAVDQNGYIFSLTKDGSVQKIAFNKFDSTKNRALTYSELVEYRRNSPNSINDSDIIQTIGSGIGLEKINAFIQDILSKVGSTETKQEAFEQLQSILGRGNAKQLSQQDYAALKAVAGASGQIGLDAIFKTSEFSKNENVGLAAQYIISILPKNMKAQLQGSFIAQGGDSKQSNSYAQQLIQMAALASADSSYHYGIDYQSDINTAAGTGAATKEKQRNITPYESLINGSLGKTDIQIRDSKDSDNTVVLHGNGMGSIPDLNGHPIPKTIASIVMDGSLGTFVDENHMTMGNQKITRADLQSIIYSGQDVANVWAPVNGNGDIDVAGLIQFNQIMEDFKRHPEFTAAEKTAILNQEYGIQGYIDESGEFHGQGNMQKFIMFTGITSDKVLDYDNGKWMDKLEGKTKDSERAEIDRIYAAINSGIKDPDAKYEFKTGIFSTGIIKAPVFLKIKNTAYNDASLFTKNGPTVTDPTYGSAIARDNMRYNAQQNDPVISPSTGYVYQQ